MDIWAPVVRWGNEGTGGLIADASTFTTVGGRFRVSSTSTDTAAHGTADQWLDAYGELVIPSAQAVSTAVGIWLRVADASNYYQVAGDIVTGNLLIKKIVAGTPTTILTGTGAWPSAGTNRPINFRAEIQGDVLRAFRNGVFGGSVRDTTFTAPGFVSMYQTATVAANLEVSRFEAGPLSASYSAAVQDAQQAGLRLAARLR